MVALARDFNVFASRVTARLSTVLLSLGYIAKAWQVRALFRRLISHQQFSNRKNTAMPFTDCIQLSKRRLLLAQGFAGFYGEQDEEMICLVSTG
jgi:hypothetical protein